MLEEDLYAIAKESGWITTELSIDAFLEKYKIQKKERQNDTFPVASKSGNPFA
jgi:hypothetical protein